MRPIIGVTGSAGRGYPMWIASWLALRLQGCRPVRLTHPAPAQIWDRLDGLLIGGGDDIGAELYGLTALPNVRVDPERDRLEIEALHRCWDSAMPILGACRGSQMMNIFKGGSLHQDIYEIYRDARRLRTVLPLKRVDLEPETALSRIIGRPFVVVNALHHQSIKDCGAGFIVSGRDEAGVVQSTEHAGAAFRIGVQWHPEFLFYKRAHWLLFRAFTDAAKRYAATRRRGAPTRHAAAPSGEDGCRPVS